MNPRSIGWRFMRRSFSARSCGSATVWRARVATMPGCSGAGPNAGPHCLRGGVFAADESACVSRICLEYETCRQLQESRHRCWPQRRAAKCAAPSQGNGSAMLVPRVHQPLPACGRLLTSGIYRFLPCYGGHSGSRRSPPLVGGGGRRTRKAWGMCQVHMLPDARPGPASRVAGSGTARGGASRPPRLLQGAGDGHARRARPVASGAPAATGATAEGAAAEGRPADPAPAAPALCNIS